MSRFLVAGASGLLGQKVFALLLQRLKPGDALVGLCKKDRGPSSDLLPLDLTDEGAVKSLCKEYRPTTVFHLAGNPNTRLAPDDPHGLAILDANLLGTFNLLKHLPSLECEIILASSLTVYGDCREDYFPRETDPYRPTSVYGVSKAAADMLFGDSDHYTTTLRFAAIVGAGATHGFLPDLMRKIKEDGEEIFLLGDDPGAVKPYIHVDDAAQVCLLAMRELEHSDYNVAPHDDAASIRDLAQIALDECGSSKKISFLGKESTWPGDNPFVKVDGQRLAKEYQLPSSKEAFRRAVKDWLKTESA